MPLKLVMCTRYENKVVVVPLGTVDVDFLMKLASSIEEVLPFVKCAISPLLLNLPEDAYNPRRRQYNSNIIMMRFQGKFKDRVLMVTKVDLYVPGLNFIFGQAECPGLLALISLARLDPRFYGEPYKEHLILDRAVKEAVHEICHTYGLAHCSNPTCVMRFSNSILDTDLKSKTLCNLCKVKLSKILERPS